MSETSVRRDRWITAISRYSEDNSCAASTDALAVEEPLEIRLRAGGATESVSVTMRTPGDDAALAVGFLYSEGLLAAGARVSVTPAGDKENAVVVEFEDGPLPDLERLRRNFYATSSCGVCGKATLEAVAVAGASKIDTDATVSAEIVRGLPALLRARQEVFEQTGGLHAAALFDAETAALIDIKEDVGRHNAVDKLVGAQILRGTLPVSPTILFLSGRASFELLQKAVMARIPFVCAVGAPSSLAVAAAREFGVTLCGFVRDGRFNAYSRQERIIAP